MKKIMFNDKYGLTRAVLEGRKTQTRRIADVFLSPFRYENGKRISGDVLVEKTINTLAKYKVGEVVAIAHSYKDCAKEDLQPQFKGQIYPPYYLYDDVDGWNNKMFVKAELMPHHIKITNIRLERLQDISEEDCLKEGVRRKNERYVVENEKGVCFYTNDVRLAFRFLIDKTCGKGTWDRNPFVFVYDFECVD